MKQECQKNSMTEKCSNETTIMNTRFAPAERLEGSELQKELDSFKNNEVLNQFLKKLPSVFMILNKYRQVVYINEGALEYIGHPELKHILGKRPGEIVGCVQSNKEIGGCGTSEACTYCGAVNAILESQQGKSVVKECRITAGDGTNAFDLRVYASPLIIQGTNYTSFTLQDIQNEKRRNAFERIFFHDVLNTTASLKSTIKYMQKNEHKINKEETWSRVNNQMVALIEEIQTQQILIQAEDKSLCPRNMTFNVPELLTEIYSFYVNHESAKNKTVQLDGSMTLGSICTDRILLRRIIGNMVINAIEASKEGESITIGAFDDGEHIRFWIHNHGFISREVQLQIFNRSFSTKGKNRGLGTYSMKILSSFLGGTVFFETSVQSGTKFTVKIPKIPPSNPNLISYLGDSPQIKDNYTCFFIADWDEASGPELVMIDPEISRIPFDAGQIAVNLFMIAQSAYGLSGNFEAQAIHLKLTEINKDAIIYFEQTADKNVRGGTRLFMLGIIATKVHNNIAAQITEIYEEIAKKYISLSPIVIADYSRRFKNILNGKT